MHLPIGDAQIMIVSAAVEIDRSASDTPRRNALTNAVKDNLRQVSFDMNSVKRNVTMVEENSMPYILFTNF